MRDSGFVGRSIPGEKLLYGVFNAIGETLPSMALARQAATFARGRARDAMREAGDAAVGTLAAMVQPFAWPLINEHREAGRQVVIATTTPYDLVKPLADWLGFDDVIATRYGVNADGTFDGSIVGPFVWARGKLVAVRQWAEANDIELAESFAYSDSVFDTPLLSAVGHPVVVNPDPSMVVMATLRRWPIRHFDVSPGVFKIPVLGIELQRIVQQFARPQLMPYVRFDIDGVDNIPDHGPAIIVMNHRSYFDARRRVDRHRPQRASGALPRQEGGVRRPGRRASSPRRWAASASSGRAVRTSRCRRRPQPSRPASSWRWRPRGRSRAVRRSSTRRSRVGGAPPGCIS